MIALLFIIVFAAAWYLCDLSHREEMKIKNAEIEMLQKEITVLKTKRKY